MRLLTKLTLAYVGVLVPVLAASLIAIWVELRRVATALGKVGGALSTVEERTQPLDVHLQGVQDAVAAATGQLAEAQEDLAHADTALGALAE